MSDYDLINGEIINVTITVDEETVTGIINTAARGPAGADGSGSNNITSATTSDGTADLDLLNVDTVTATVTGTLTADHIHGNLAGNVYGHIRAGETLAKGDPVYVSGSHGSGSTLIPIVSKADASNAAKMPAVGIMDAAVANNLSGHMVIVGTITELNTAAYSVNAELYVAAGGGFTATPPTARAQPVARVERANANNGAVIVKVNGLSASDATASTLVRRDAIGGASFVGLNTSTLDSSGITTTGQVEFNGTDAGDSLTFNMVNYFYGTGAASAHRIALGAGTTGAELFGAATAAAARTTLGLSLPIAVASGGTGTTNGSITGTGALTFTAGGSNQNINLTPSGTGIVRVTKASGQPAFQAIGASNSYPGFYAAINGEIASRVGIELDGANTNKGVLFFTDGTTKSLGLSMISSGVIGIGSGAANSFAGSLKATNAELAGTTASTSTTTGALVVSGGVGIAGSINAGGTLAVTGVSTLTGGATFGGSTQQAATRIALGAGTTGAELFGAATAAAARTTLELGATNSPTFGGLDLLTATTTTLNVYNSLSGANFERLSFRWASNIARIGTAKGGTGTARDLVLETDGTERIRVSAAGNVGIGTTSPSRRLSIEGSLTSGADNFGIVVRNTNSAGYSELAFNNDTVTAGGAFVFGYGGSATANANEAYFFQRRNASLLFGTNNLTRMVIAGDGNVGIGTTSPSALLDVNSNTVRLRTARTPASAAAAGNAGDICWDANYIYVCTATNTWKRTAISTWP